MHNSSMRVRQLIGAASVALLVGACGGGSSSVEVSGAPAERPGPAPAALKTEEQAGQCVARDGASEEVLALPDVLLEPTTWVELNGATPEAVGEGLVELTPAAGKAKALRGQVPAKLRAPEDTARLVDEELKGGSTVLVGTDFVGFTAASLRPNGTVVFLGHCADKNYTKPFKDFVKATVAKGGSKDAAAVLRSIAANPSGPEAAAFQDWAYLEPRS